MRKIDALTPRERVILFVLTLAGVWLLIDTALLAPQAKARKAEQQKIAQAQLRITEAEQLLTLRAAQPAPDRDVRQRLESARGMLDARLRSTAQIQARMIAPQDQARVLQGLLGEFPGLRLRSLDTLPAEPLGLPDAGPPGTATSPPAPAALYKHGVKLTVVGGYAALTRYMEKLEKLPVGFYWARAELDAGEHPEISLTLILYTLSLEPTWLTV
jgi:MSHA biogenesis protein MshJ